MSEQEASENGSGKQVSKGRKIVSGIILIGLLVVLGIEGRAGFGHSSSAKALQAIAPQGAFEAGTLTEEQIDAMMSMSPTKEKLENGGSTVEYKYSWKSVIRPLMSNMAPTDLYVSFSQSEPPYALLFGTDPPEPPREPGKNPGGVPASSSPPPLEMPSMEPSLGKEREGSDASVAKEADIEDEDSASDGSANDEE